LAIVNDKEDPNTPFKCTFSLTLDMAALRF